MEKERERMRWSLVTRIVRYGVKLTEEQMKIVEKEIKIAVRCS